ncbi:uncharacterized protein LOC119648195 [Hermetia illucens]|uniref:uncharacterized protein LOC119648195 n=1 Tax=Hermetia illucens TaxID=343691 RepID=UPI0018CC3AE3|nr:uncharacterized protein LOC119648195 [Hermetia illucens]XP_037905715.1 uncharacterized protein LOC119648195 [Hermetia illucens]
MSSHRLPRRTRVYDANYNIGQSYYKPALDDLDRKYYGRSAETNSTPRVNFDLDTKIDDDLKAARSRAAKAIAEEAVFDSRGIRSRKGAPLSSAFEDDDEDLGVRQSLTRIRAAKKQIAQTISDFEAEDDFASMRKRGGETARKYLELDGEDDFRSKPRSRRLLDMDGEEDTGRSKFRPRRLLDMDGEEDTGSRLKSRALKGISRLDDDSSTSAISSSFKRVAISDTVESSNSAASMRAQATKARLADIESEMSERSEKMLEREKRAANLKKFLAETDMEAITAE